MKTSNINKKSLRVTLLLASIIGLGQLFSTSAMAQINVQPSDIAAIYELQAAFHRAKTTQDIDLMMSLWDANGVLNVRGDPNSPYTGFDRIKAFWLQSGSFTHRRFSLVPSFKTRIDVQGDLASLYFECHDIGDFDLPSRFIAADLFLAGTLRKQEGRWVFSNMTAGRAFPLSVNQYYYP